MIAFSCDKCGKQFKLNPEFAGRTTTCSGCKAPLVVPEPVPVAKIAPTIAFWCDNCGMKFNVPDEFAGRKTSCPTCKHTLVVPAPDATCAYQPALGGIKGTQSSLVQAGLHGGVTLAGDFATAEALSMQNLIDGKANDGARYIIESELARGGMGVVMRAVDCDIRREVAVKYLLDQSDEKKKSRFREEAQITGQLEHPNIVPIHELCVDSEKRIFFSMKMVKGRSLADILSAQRKDEQTTKKGRLAPITNLFRGSTRQENEFSQGRLLNIFVNVCNAIAFAHARGVVHRDLKPANIMVGDFGEVYVMDWGLAKVLRGGVATTTGQLAMAMPVAKPVEPFDFNVPVATPVTPTETAAPSSGTRVVTSREMDADLTQQGAVLGTPVYMPPEQAAGKLDEIDERSDIYSMGAILYEILTLQPPINKEGGYWPILLRVKQGEIAKPEQKAPERAKAGKVPPELAAVAMKALANRKRARYATVEALRTDIERFMEGRSVSAKHDTIREMTAKLVKRNLGVSIATAAAVVILFVLGVWSLIAIVGANARTRQEQKEKIELAKKSVPSFVRAAKLLINEKQFEDAFNQVNTAVNFDETNPDARFVRAQLLLARQEFADAGKDLEACLKAQPNFAAAKKLLNLARDARADDKVTLLALAGELSRQKAHMLADKITQDSEKLMASRQELLELYQVRVEAAWPGCGRHLQLDGNANFTLNFPNEADVSSFEPLRGIPLYHLNCPLGNKVASLEPLRGMPLVHLGIGHSVHINDLSPLAGMRLEGLQLGGCIKVSDLSPLAGMPIKNLQLHNCVEVSDLAPLKGMPLTQLNVTSCGNITDLTPLKGMQLTDFHASACPISDLTVLAGMPLKNLAFSGTPQLKTIAPLKNMPLESLSFGGGTITDLSPLASTKLTYLYIRDVPAANLSALKGLPLVNLGLDQCPNISDLSPLQGTPLTVLSINSCSKITDITPLKGLKLTSLNVAGSGIEDLAPVKEMPLTHLSVNSSPVKDIGPLKGLKLIELGLHSTQVKDLEPLRGMPLITLNVSKSEVADVSPLADTKLAVLVIDDTAVSDLTRLKALSLKHLSLRECKELHDLTPLAKMKLDVISLPPEVTKGIETIRAMKSLQTIDGLPSLQFWKLWDAAKSKGK